MPTEVPQEKEMTPPSPQMVELRGDHWRFTIPNAVVIALASALGATLAAQLPSSNSGKLDAAATAAQRLEAKLDATVAKLDSAVEAQQKRDKAQDETLAAIAKRLEQ